jgi:lysophospholipase L1-like esterase
MSAIDRLQTRLADDKGVTWNFLGDSIAHGAVHTWGFRDYIELFDEKVRVELSRRLDIVINGSYNGYRVGPTFAELAHRCLRFKPDVVLIALGMNDAASGAGNLENFSDTIRRIIGEVRDQCGSEIVLQTPILIDYANAASRSALPQFADAVRELAANEDALLCDHYAAWEAYVAGERNQLFYLLDDPFHPNAHGHTLMAQTLLAALQLPNDLRLSPLQP